MARYKPYDYSQSMMMPVSLQDQLIPGTLEFAIHYLVDNDLDLLALDGKFSNDDTGRPAYDPRVLLKVVLLAYSRGIIHSRKIERACRENITFMALACGQVPDHSTIATFVSSMKDEIEPLFRDVLLACEEMNLLGSTVFSLDGCKLPSNASKEWSGTHQTLRKKQRKLEEKVKELIENQIEADQSQDNPSDLAKRDKQIKRIRENVDRIQEFLGKNGARIGRTGKEIKCNITDNESAYMKTSHGTVQGFNAQAVVNEKQVITAARVFGNGQDYGHLEPMIEEARQNLGSIGYPSDYMKGKTFLADSNYHCEDNLKVCVDEKIDAYIPDVYFRKRDQRFETQANHKPKKSNRFTIADFNYDQENDRYICPNGKELKLRAERAKTGNHVFRKYAIKDGDCTRCKLASKCLEKRGGKKKHLSILIETAPSYHQSMVEKIDTEEGRRKYEKRLGMVEPVFANIRTQKRMDRFTLRGKVKVNIQWLLYCMVHNIEKLGNHGYGHATK